MPALINFDFFDFLARKPNKTGGSLIFNQNARKSKGKKPLSENAKESMALSKGSGF
jgi:hypothetical protein